MIADCGVRIDAYLPAGGPGWVNTSVDVISDVPADWGIHSSLPTERVAGIGKAELVYDNSELNSGGVRGYYTPGHPSVRAGFAVGTPIRLVLTHPLFGERVRWVGTILSIQPSADESEPYTKVECADWMREPYRSRMSGMPVMVDTQADEVFDALVDAIPKQPPTAAQITAGSDVYPYALDNTQDEKRSFADEFNKLAKSEYGLIYVKAGKPVFEGRSIRAAGGSPKLALDQNNIISIGIEHDSDDVINRVDVSIHPRRRDGAATTVLFNLGSSQRIERNTSITINCPYRDPNQQAQRVGGVDMAAPVAGTDYIFTENADGTGAVLTSQLEFTPAIAFGGNAADVVVKNNGPLDGYLTKLQLKGRGLYDFEPVFSRAEDATSITAYGENELVYDMPYQASPSIASDTASFILFLQKDPATRVRSVTFLANWDEDTLLKVFDIDISDRVSITLPAVNLNGEVFYINGIKLHATIAGAVYVTYDLALADTTQFWTLEVDGATELGLTTILGYGLFAKGWILGTDVLGSTTSLN